MKKFKIIISVVFVLIIIGGLVYYYKFYNNKEKNLPKIENIVKKEEKKIKTFAGDKRPIAVMIDNGDGSLPHAGLDKAYMIYEIIVEGGESRLMALYKGEKVDKIGPVRSLRHYYIDYAFEHDAIIAHFGWSPQAEKDVKSLGIENLNGIFFKNSKNEFWRVRDKRAPHNVVVTSDNIYSMAKGKKYRLNSNTNSVLKYSIDEVNLEEAKNADRISIIYSHINNVEWNYNKEEKVYERKTKKKNEVDWDTKKQYKAKNIIVTFVENYRMNDDEKKDRQTLKTLGEKSGYYFTNGKYIKILCTKNTRQGKTKYTDLTGKEIDVNDGNTFVQIVPETKKSLLKIEDLTPKTSEDTNTIKKEGNNVRK